MPLSLSCTLLRHERHVNSVRVAMQPQSPASSQGALQALHRLACRTCTARGTHREERVVAGLARGSHLRRRVVARPCGRPHGPWRRPLTASSATRPTPASPATSPTLAFSAPGLPLLLARLARRLARRLLGCLLAGLLTLQPANSSCLNHFHTGWQASAQLPG